MAILQALLALITRSAGKILNAIFGWAVHALFGKTTARDQTLLSGLVGAAVVWPLLVAGIAFPKIAAMALAFVPIPHAFPTWIVRVVWMALALGVPLALGVTLAARSRGPLRKEPLVKRLLRGFPITLGLALAFLIMFVSIPIMRLVSMVRREKTADIPLMTDVAAYHEVAAQVVEALNKHGFALRSAQPAWWVRAPTRILSWFGGSAFSGFVPQTIEHHVGSDLEVSFYTSGVLLRGKGSRVTWAHGLIVEVTAQGSGLQTFAPAAQEVERQVRQVWTHLDSDRTAFTGSPVLLGRVRELARGLARLDVEYDEWQVVYREILQLERAVRGEPPLLDDVTEGQAVTNKENVMNVNDKDNSRSTSVKTTGDAAIAGRTATQAEARPALLSTAELVKEIGQQVTALAKTELELAKAELRADLSAEVAMATGLGVGAMLALVALGLWLVTAILALAQVVPGWEAGLLVSGVVSVGAAVAAGMGWSRRVRRPMQTTRHELEVDKQWTKDHVAQVTR